MTTVRSHVRHTRHGAVRVHRHHRDQGGRNPWSKSDPDGLAVAAGALVLSFVTMVVWALTAFMSVTAAILSVITTVALTVLGFKVNKKRRARAAHKRYQQRNRPRPAQTRTRRYRNRLRKATHPLRTARAGTRKRIKKARRKLGRRLEKRWQARAKGDPR